MRHLLILVMLAAVPARAATPTPDWPCVQPRQSHLSLGQVWTGPPPPEGAAETPEIAALADRVVQRRMPIEEATAASHSLTQEAQGLAQLIERFRLSDDLSTSSSPVHQAQARVLAFARS